MMVMVDEGLDIQCNLKHGICLHDRASGKWEKQLSMCRYCCVTKLLWRKHCSYLPTLEREPMTDKVWAPPESNLIQQWVLLGLLTEVWVRMTHQGSPQREWQLTKLGSWSSLFSLSAAQQVRGCPFQGSLLVQTSLRKLSWFCFSWQRVWPQSLQLGFVREMPSDSGEF